jgi:hypothetical protein
MARQTRDLTGQTFNSWHVIEFSHKGKTNKSHWRCRCSCGAEKIVDGYNLTSGRSKSCRPCSAKVVAQNIHVTHGLSQSREYKAWQAMKTRCLNPNAEKAYKYHGALGVKVHPEWIDDFLCSLPVSGQPPRTSIPLIVLTLLAITSPAT